MRFPQALTFLCTSRPPTLLSRRRFGAAPWMNLPKSSPTPPLPDPGDATLDRAGTCSRKWDRFGPDCVPLWVADMDFRAPPPVIAAVRSVAEHGVYGYTDPSPALGALAAGRLEQVYGLEGAEPSWIRWQPGLLPGLNHACRTLPPGGAVVVATPIYPPFLAAPTNCGRPLIEVPLACTPDLERDASGRLLRYGLDLPALGAALARPDVECLLWCNPHNPTGRVWTRAELRAVAELCVQHGVLLLSDEAGNRSGES